MKSKYTIKEIAELGIFTGIAIVLNLSIFKFHITASGGSISFVMVPLFVIAIRHSWWKTLISTGIVYALVACLIGGYGFATFPFDYFIPYGSICLISLVRNKILQDGWKSYLYLIISIILVTTIRFFSSTISSILIYEYQFIPAIIYNAPYVFITGGIGLAFLLILLNPLKYINKKNKC